MSRAAPAAAAALAALLLLLAAAEPARAQPRPAAAASPANAATLTLQFDNRKKSVSSPQTEAKIRDVLARRVFLVPASQVKLVGGIDQSGVLTRQAVVTYRAVGPTTNGQSVLANCQANTAPRALGLRSSVAKREVARATDTWWPGDKVDVQKASCAAA